MQSTSAAKVLVVDDELVAARAMSRALERDGYVTESAHDLRSARDRLGEFRPDAIVLDAVLPDAEGPAHCRALRAEHPDLAILLVTPKGEAFDQVTGLDAGADDYLVRPFSLRVLEARLRAVLRRRQPSPEVLTVGDLTLDTSSRLATRAGRTITLTATEYRLLVNLMRAQGKPIPKHELTQRVWGYDFTGNDNVLEVYVGYVRAKLEANGEPRMIQTLRGVGYALRAPA